MKKILTVLLSLCLLVSLAACFAISANAEEAEDISVTVGQKFEWNSQKGELAKQRAWAGGKGKSPDGLWKYQFYSHVKQIYGDLVYSSAVNCYAWTKDVGSSEEGLNYARAREFGLNFHPGKEADVVKVFTCPSGGTVELQTIATRLYEVGEGTTGTSIAIYLEDQLVYPEEGGGDYLLLDDTTTQDFKVTIDVAKNQRIYIHVGGVDKNIGGDAINMENFVTYTAVNDASADTSDKTLSLDIPTAEDEDLTLTDMDATGSVGGSAGQSSNQGGAGWVLWVVIAAVVVVILVVVVVIVKKKKAQ